MDKGKLCFSEYDCTTTDPEVFGECKCGFNSQGYRYCDLIPGDEEWQKAISSVQFYQHLLYYILLV